MEAFGGIGLYEGLVLGAILILLVIPIVIAYKLARYKGLPVGRWVLLAAIFNWPIVVALLVFPRREEARTRSG